MRNKILLVVAMSAAFIGGLLIPRPAQVSYVTTEVDVPVEVEKIIEKPVYVDREVNKEVEKIVYRDKLVIPRWFTSEAELKTWLSTHRVGIEIGIPLDNKNGVSGFEGNSVDCDDYSELLMKLGFADGYILLPAPVNQGYFWDEFVYSAVGPGGRHIGIWTWIGNDFYYIEPMEQNKLTKLQTLRDLP